MIMATACVARAGVVPVGVQQTVTSAIGTTKGELPRTTLSSTSKFNYSQQRSICRHAAVFGLESSHGLTITTRTNLLSRRKCRHVMIVAATTNDSETSVEDGVEIAIANEGDDCNEESCAPEKEVGKVSMAWEAQEKTQVAGTYPPMVKGPATTSTAPRAWTGYVEKDTAGQTNIYSVEPSVYVSEGAMSTSSLSAFLTGTLALLAVGGALLYVATTKPQAPVTDPNVPVETVEKGSGRSEVKRARALGLNLPEDFPVQAPETASTESAAEESPADVEASSTADMEAEAEPAPST